MTLPYITHYLHCFCLYHQVTFAATGTRNAFKVTGLKYVLPELREHWIEGDFSTGEGYTLYRAFNNPASREELAAWAEEVVEQINGELSDAGRQQLDLSTQADGFQVVRQNLNWLIGEDEPEIDEVPIDDPAAILADPAMALEGGDHNVFRVEAYEELHRITHEKFRLMCEVSLADSLAYADRHHTEWDNFGWSP